MKEVGWYAKLKLFEKRPINFLVDTGASVTLIDVRLWRKLIVPRTGCNLDKVADEFVLADGSPLKVEGQLEIQLWWGRRSFKHDVVIADLGQEHAILGLDFLERYEAQLDLRTGTATLGPTVITLRKQGQEMGCSKISALKNCVIQPQTSQVIEISVDEDMQACKEIRQDGYGVIEMSTGLEEMGLYIASQMVSTENVIRVTAINALDHEIKVKKGSVMGKISPVSNFLRVNGDSCKPTTQSEATPATSSSLVGSVEPATPKKLLTSSDVPTYARAAIERADELSPEQLSRVCELILDYKEVFKDPDGPDGSCTIGEGHSINVEGQRPVKQAYRPMPPVKQQEVNKEVHSMLEKNIIEPSYSPWASPVVLVTKKDGTTRFCVDYRRLNALTRKDAFPLPRIQDVLGTMGGARYFCTMDLASGYWQIRMQDQDKEKTAFVTRQGLFHFKTMPFGLCNAPATFQRVMEKVLMGLQWEQCLVYLDDIIIFGPTFEETLQRLHHVLDRLKIAGLKLKAKKCDWFRRSVEYLGHIVSPEGLRCDPKKVEAVLNWPVPSSTKEVRSFLGFASYYRKFLPNFSDIAEPLHRLTRKHVRFIWCKGCQEALELLQEKLTAAPVLAFPRDEGEFILDTDASNHAVGAVLSQIQDDEEVVIAYASKQLTDSQRNYCTTKKELYAVVTFVGQFKQYLYGKPFTIRTDHASLTWLTNFRNVEDMLARWLTILDPYSFTIVHRQGAKHGNADGLSRIITRPCSRPDCPDCEPIRRQRVSEVSVQTVVSVVKDESSFVNTDRDDVYSVNNDDVMYSEDTVDHSLHTESSVYRVCPVQRDENDVHSDEDEGSEDEVLEDSGQDWLEPWTTDELRTWQREDPVLGTVIQWKEMLQERPDRHTLAGRSNQLFCYWLMYNDLHLENGVLVRKSVRNHLPGGVRTQIVAPGPIRSRILMTLHNSPTAAHLGQNKLVNKIKHRFFWSGYKKSAKLWVQRCDTCARCKRGAPRERMTMGHVPVAGVLDRVAADLVGPLPETAEGYKYILTVEDYFTKWTEAYPLKNKTAAGVADQLMVNFVSRFGVPRSFHTDQGTEFTASVIRELSSLLRLRKTRTVAWNPKSDGLVERSNQTLKSMLKTMVGDAHHKWNDHLPYVLMAYRSSVQESTKFTPNMLMLNRETTLPVDLMYGDPPENEVCHIEYVEWVRQACQYAYRLAEQNISTSVQRQRMYYNRKSGAPRFEIGQSVWRYYPPAARPKFGRGWKGPYLITGKINDHVYSLQRTQRDRVRNIHVDHLKLYQGMAPVKNWLKKNQEAGLAELEPPPNPTPETNTSDGAASSGNSALTPTSVALDAADGLEASGQQQGAVGPHETTTTAATSTPRMGATPETIPSIPVSPVPEDLDVPYVQTQPLPLSRDLDETVPYGKSDPPLVPGDLEITLPYSHHSTPPSAAAPSHRKGNRKRVPKRDSKFLYYKP